MPPKITRVRWSASNLPWGISFNEQTGTFTGTADKDDVGEYDIPITVETNFGRHQQYLHLNVLEKVEWEEVALPDRYTIRKNIPVLEFKNGSQNKIMIFCSFVDSSNNSFYQLISTRYLPSASWVLDGAKCSISNTASAFVWISKIYQICQINNESLYVIAGQFSQQYAIRLSYDGIFRAESTKYASQTWMACCYSTAKSATFLFVKNGTAVKVVSFTNSSSNKNSYSTGISNINPGCAATKGSIMCITSSNYQSATSTDGETWQKASTPDNLVELRYESSFGKFLARGENTKLFFVSDDGLNWTQYNYTPPPLNTVKSTAYSGAYGFCAIGIGEDGTETHAAHSPDGENWTLKKITNNKNISFTNVIYVGGTVNSFVAAPTTGSYIYCIRGANVQI